MENGFDPAIFARRRVEFMKRMGSGVAILASAPEALRNGDVHHGYRQDSDFYYLTGFSEAGSIALIAPDHPEHKFVLFVPKRDRAMETWHGRRAGPEGAVKDFGADAAFTLEEADKLIPGYLENVRRLLADLMGNSAFAEKVKSWVGTVKRKQREGVFAPTEFIAPGEIIHPMRLIKDDDDLRFMRRATQLTAEGHIEGMKATRPGMMEYEVQAVMEGYWKQKGCKREGYGSIVAGGENATILHYVTNDAELKDGELLLVDAACEYGLYSGDITRTWPINGEFTPVQRKVYDCVLEAQLAAIDRCREGVSFIDVHWAAVEVLTRGMVEMGLLEGDPAEIIATQKQWEEDVKAKKVDLSKDKAPRTYFEFYMHKTSHWLGMDVHDVGGYNEDGGYRALKAGNILTVEPGIYVRPDSTDVPEEYRGIGIRIEDDVLVTTGEPDVLTAAVPKSAEEIEKLMAASRAGV